MASPEQFQRRLEALARNVERGGRRAVREAARAGVEALVYGTPIGGAPSSPNDPHPGLARSNWSAGIGGPEPERPPEDPAETIARAEGVLAALTGEEVTISNPVPYVGRLNDGHSTQAPSGFVEAALEAAARAAGAVRLLDDR